MRARHLTHSMLEKVCRRNTEILYFPQKKMILTFHANCLLRDNLHEMSKSIFGKSKKNISLSSPEFATSGKD